MSKVGPISITLRRRDWQALVSVLRAASAIGISTTSTSARRLAEHIQEQIKEHDDDQIN